MSKLRTQILERLAQVQPAKPSTGAKAVGAKPVQNPAIPKAQQPKTIEPIAPKTLSGNPPTEPIEPTEPEEAPEQDNKNNTNSTTTSGTHTTAKASELFELVKNSIDTRVRNIVYAKRYYQQIKELAAKDMLEKKAVLVNNLNGSKIVAIANEEDVDIVLDSNALSLYYPVDLETTDFRIGANSINDMVKLSNFLSTQNINSVMTKNANGMFLRCSCDSISTSSLFDSIKTFADTNKIDVSLKDLTFGNIKRASYSLSDDGSCDVEIELGE